MQRMATGIIIDWLLHPPPELRNIEGQSVVGRLYRQLRSCPFIEDVYLFFRSVNEIKRKPSEDGIKFDPVFSLNWLKEQKSELCIHGDVLVVNSNVYLKDTTPLEKLWRLMMENPGATIFALARQPDHHPILYKSLEAQNDVYRVGGLAVNGPWRYDTTLNCAVSPDDGRPIYRRQDFPPMLYLDTSILLIREEFWSEGLPRARIAVCQPSELLTIKGKLTYLKAVLEHRRNRENADGSRAPFSADDTKEHEKAPFQQRFQ